jgi:hypothetical protein
MLAFFKENQMNTTTLKSLIETIVCSADEVAVKHGNYVDNFVSRANNELYEILADIMKIYEQIEKSPHKDKLIKSLKQRLKNCYGLKVQSNTKLTALITKYVTRSSRKTAHVYSRVLEVAIANGISSDQLVEFIKQKGGVDRMRLMVNAAETKRLLKVNNEKNRAELIKKLNARPGICDIDLSAIKELPHASDVNFQHLICRYNYKSGKYEIVAVMYPSSVLEERALKDYLVMLDAASKDDRREFYDKCSEYGLNMDILHRWMRANKFDSADAVGSMVRELQEAVAMA